ncbi:MAG: ABC transporter substrate-binding protein [Betaproteobacteria bacterium]|nr:ABC transporter substrate-binding protein [Betaproteobacteria bacterium]MCC6249741.1 ABC transporter substrate-binding protein [Rubrivivax sp.]
MKRWLVTLAAALLPLAAAAQPGSAGTLVIGFGQAPRHLNSAVQSGVATGVPAAQIFASPLRFDKDWNPEPYLAESWSFQDDGKSLLLKIRAGATFHDGRPITSEDVAFSIMTIKANHPFQAMFAPVERVDTPSPQIAIIRMSAPHPAILLAMAPPFAPIIPKHVFGDGADVRTHPKNNLPVGSGPYRVVSFNPREAIVLERYPGFFFKDRPQFERVIFRMISDNAAQALALEKGEVDLLPGSVTLSQFNQLSKAKDVVLSRRGGEAIGPLGWLAFNLKRKPFDDVRVRQAIAHAIDRDFIVKSLHQGITKVATGPIAPGSPFYSDKVERYPLDLKKAAALLDAAGLKPDGSGRRFGMTVDFLPNTPDNSQTIAEYLRPQLKKIGIEVTVRTSPDFPTWARRVATHDFDATMDGAFNYGDPVIGVHRTYLSSNIKPGVIWSNTQNYVNPKVDELLAQATVEKDLEKRKKLYAEFQRLVVADVPQVFTHVWGQGYAARKDLVNVPESIWAPMVPFDQMSRRK